MVMIFSRSRKKTLRNAAQDSSALRASVLGSVRDCPISSVETEVASTDVDTCWESGYFLANHISYEKRAKAIWTLRDWSVLLGSRAQPKN